MTNPDDPGFGVGFVFSLLIVALPILIIGGCQWSKADDVWRRDAVGHGAAEFVLDPKTGESQWRWKDQTPEAKK